MFGTFKQAPRQNDYAGADIYVVFTDNRVS